MVNIGRGYNYTSMIYKRVNNYFQFSFSKLFLKNLCALNLISMFLLPYSLKFLQIKKTFLFHNNEKHAVPPKLTMRLIEYNEIF